MSEMNETRQIASAPAQRQPYMREQEMEVDLVELFYMYLGHIWQIVLILMAGAILSLCVTKFCITPKYTATAKIYIVSASNDSVVNLSDLQIGAQLTKDYEELLKIHPLLEEVITNLQLNITYDELLHMVNVVSPANTRLLYVTVKSPSPTQAANIANEIAELSIFYLPEIMECAPPHIADRALIPIAPSSPSTVKNTVLGGFAAVLVYCIILLVGFMMNDTFKSQEDIEKYLGETPLCVIPEANFSGQRRQKKNSASRSRADT